MKNTLFIIGRFLGVLIFIIAFSIAGIVSGKPIMILAYAGFFILVMFSVFMFVRRNQRHFEIVSSSNPLVSKIIGAVLILVAIAIPGFVISNMQLFDLGNLKVGFKLIALLEGITVCLVAAGVSAVILINKATKAIFNKILGYLLLIVISAVPAILVIPYDRTTTGIGSVYYMVIIVAVLSWWGFSLFQNKD